MTITLTHVQLCLMYSALMTAVERFEQLAEVMSKEPDPMPRLVEQFKRQAADTFALAEFVNATEVTQ